MLGENHDMFTESCNILRQQLKNPNLHNEIRVVPEVEAQPEVRITTESKNENQNKSNPEIE